MRTEPNLRVERMRKTHPTLGDSAAGANWGFFQDGPLRIISSGTPVQGGPGWPWEHVSVSRADRCPTWEEMDGVKRLFWRDDETVVQFHPRDTDRVNFHPTCLHLWRMVGAEPELPPRELLT